MFIFIWKCAGSSALHRLLSGCREQGLLWLRCGGFPLRWLLLDVGSRARELQCWAHGLSCAAAYGVFLDQEESLCLLHWQVDSLPLIPTIMFKLVISRKTLDFFLVSSDLAALLLATGRIRRPSPLFRWAVDPLIATSHWPTSLIPVPAQPRWAFSTGEHVLPLRHVMPHCLSLGAVSNSGISVWAR